MKITREEYARLEAEFEQLMAQPLPRAKPPSVSKRMSLTIPVSDAMAEAVRLNPQSVRIWARANGVTIVEKPHWVME
jgi:hypothetical protein